MTLGENGDARATVGHTSVPPPHAYASVDQEVRNVPSLLWTRVPTFGLVLRTESYLIRHPLLSWQALRDHAHQPLPRPLRALLGLLLVVLILAMAHAVSGSLDFAAIIGWRSHSVEAGVRAWTKTSDIVANETLRAASAAWHSLLAMTIAALVTTIVHRPCRIRRLPSDLCIALIVGVPLYGGLVGATIFRDALLLHGVFGFSTLSAIVWMQWHFTYVYPVIAAYTIERLVWRHSRPRACVVAAESLAIFYLAMTVLYPG